MHAASLLRSWFGKSLENIHQARISTLFLAVDSLLFGKKLSLTALGRSFDSSIKTKHAIKRIDRLLGNKFLYADRISFFRALALMVIKNCQHPRIIVDASKVSGDFYELRAAVSYQGRALSIYTEVHDKKDIQKHQVLKAFLLQLKSVIAKNCKPILVTDAGFCTPWFRAVTVLGWDYVGRVRNIVHARSLVELLWEPAKALYQDATMKAKNLGQFLLCKSKPLQVRLVLFKGTATSGKRKRPVKSGTTRQKAKKSAKEPWLLATSLESNPKHIVAIYSQRMQIEETFRDQKNLRNGWGSRHMKSSDPHRLLILLLIAILAQWVSTVIGRTLEKKGRHYDFQSNTVRKHRVLSLVNLGIIVYQKRRQGLVTVKELLSTINIIRTEIKKNCII